MISNECLNGGFNERLIRNRAIKPTEFNKTVHFISLQFNT